MSTRVERRTRYRAEVLADVKQAALAQIERDGVSALSLSKVARELGYTGPALYKYVDSRDGLLTLLIVDAYQDLAAATREAVESTTADTPRVRLHAIAAAYRGWALREPHRYLLLTGPPVPHYAAPAETVSLARAVLAPLATVMAQSPAALADASLARQVDAWLRDPDVRSWIRFAASPAPSAQDNVALEGLLRGWVRLHGLVSLESVGMLGGMGFDPGDLLAAEVDALADHLSFG